jgi:hypothetical protein
MPSRQNYFRFTGRRDDCIVFPGIANAHPSHQHGYGIGIIQLDKLRVVIGAHGIEHDFIDINTLWIGQQNNMA